VVAAGAPFLWIRPAYAVQPAAAVETLQPLGATFGDQMRLIAYDVAAPQPLYPGDTVAVTLAWEALAPLQRDWSVFVHLNDPVLQTPIAQRDMYTGQGLLPTRLLRPGEPVVDRYLLRVPPSAPAPAELEVVTGLYDFYSLSGERLVTSRGDVVRLESLQLAGTPGSYPNPVAYNFGDELELVGFQAEPRRLEAGETLALSLYWRALRDLSLRLHPFRPGAWRRHHPLGRQRRQPKQRWLAHFPAGVPGETQVVEMVLPLEPDTPPGVYPIVVGAYRTLDEGGWRRLQLVEEGRITMADHLRLVQVRVE
jgi:hypothetical protein